MQKRRRSRARHDHRKRGAVLRVVFPRHALLWAWLAIGLLVGLGPRRAFAASPALPRFERILSTGAFLTGAALQDRHGLIWMGSQGSGLYRYDGYELTTFQAGPSSISDDNVLALLQDHEGVLWLATAHGLTSYDKRTDAFKVFVHDTKDPTSLPGNAFNVGLQTLYEDRAGRLWIGTRAGLCRYDRANGTFERHAAPGQAVHDVFALTEDHDGVLWVGTTKALCRVGSTRAKDECFAPDPTHPDSLDEGGVVSLLESRSRDLWIGTPNGLQRFDRARGRFVRYPRVAPAGAGPVVQHVHALREDEQGRLWLAHGLKGGGLTMFDPRDGSYRSLLPGIGNDGLPSSSSVAGFLTDSTSITWVLHLGGQVDHNDPNVHHITNYRHDPEDPKTISDVMVNTSYVDRQGRVWFATPNGLNLLDRETGQFTRYPHDSTNPAAIPGGFVCGPYEDSQGNFWVISDGFLSLFDRDQGRTVASYETVHLPISVGEDRRDANVLWLVSWGEGLARFDKTTHAFERFRHRDGDPDSISNDLLVTFHQAADGRIWLPTMGGGLDIFDPTTRKVVEHYRHDPTDPKSVGSDTLTHVFVDSRERVWVGTYGGGLNRFVPESRTFERRTMGSGFPTNTVTNILEDDLGNLWLGTKMGFVRFNPDTGATRVYTVDDGLAGNQFQEAALAKSADGTIWVATITGASSFRPRDLVDNPHVPPVVLTSLTQGGVSLPLGMAVEEVRSIALDWRNNHFAFEFAALNYTRSKKNRYRFLLEGFDKDWFDAGTRRFGRYANLPDGEYTLRIVGSNNDGVWNKEGVSLRVSVAPPFWRSTWFRALAVLLGLGVVATLTGLRAAHTRRERMALERDIAERKEREAELRAAMERFESLVDNVPGAIYRAGFDESRRMEFLSAAFSAIGGADPEAFVGPETGAFDELLHPDDRPDVLARISEAVAAQRAFELEYRLCAHDGVERWVLDRGKGQYDEDGKLLWIDGALFDVTKRRNLEAQVLHAQKIDSVGRLAGGIAHDLNNLMTAVIGNAELLLLDADGGSAEGLTQILSAGQRAGELTGQLLQFARRSIAEPQVIDLAALVIRLDKMIRRLLGEGIELVTLPEQPLWRVKVDPGQFEQVLVNLAVNARDAMPAGGRIAIRVENATIGQEDQVPAGEYVVLSVTDNGVGMPESVMRHVFEPFYTTKGQGKGTGLGLATCHGIVTQSKGHITVESTPGKGTTFRVYLPRTDEALESARDVDDTSAVGGDERILLVEDEALVRSFVAKALEARGYRVLRATDGEDALRVARQTEGAIDMVLTDVVMPVMGGHELARRMVEAGFGGAILFMSGYSEEAIAHEGVLDPGVELIKKPFLASDLVKRVREVLDRRRT